MSASLSTAVAVALSEHFLPKIYLIPEIPEQQLTLDGLRYVDSGLGDWFGFYDWLRNTKAEVIGFRLWMDEVNVHLESLSKCQQVERGVHGEILVQFATGEEEYPPLSDDQDFGSNRLFLGENGFVFTFNPPSRR